LVDAFEGNKMTTLLLQDDFSTESTVRTVGAGINSFFTRVVFLYRRSQQRHQLRNLSEAMRADIGKSYIDIRMEAGKAFWAD
jgi:uncharacterized protein YjiS (DUF1127 family)